MTPDELQARVKQFAVRLIPLCDALEVKGLAARELAKQIVRSGTSVSANYRAARRARSHKEFVAKIGVVAEEADETQHWLELISAAGYLSRSRLVDLQNEAGELVAIFSRTAQTARRTAKARKIAPRQLPNCQITQLPNHNGRTKNA